MTGVKVVKPSNCSVPGGELTTSPFTGEVIMDPTAGSTVMFTRLFPEKAETGFNTVEFSGALCPLAEDSATLKGSVCGEAVHTNAGGTGYESNLTDGIKPVTILLVGSAQQATGDSTAKPCAMTFNGAAAQMTGAIDFELAGTNAGKGYGAD
jgi:hypothetical protein